MAQRFLDVSKIAIIGAGAGGLAAAKYLLAEKCFQQIDIFEQRDQVGGVWNYSPASDKSHVPISIPHDNPRVPTEEPIWHSKNPSDVSSPSDRTASFVSPLYEGLETNIPISLMRFSDLDYPTDTQLFPDFDTVRLYLEEYSRDVRHLIHFHVQVVDVKQKGEYTGSWTVRTKDLKSGVLRTDVYDAVIVANGHYNVPYVPSIPGISDWNDAYHGAISHSKLYDAPECFRNKKVIIVGNSASGIDIGSQINTVCLQPLLSSTKSESYFSTKPVDNRAEYPPIEEFLAPGTYNRAVRFSNGSIVENIDAILFCTGYLYSYPFLSSLEPPVIEDGSRTTRLFQHLFYTEHPTLIFQGLTQKAIPFPIVENQSAVFARVLSGRLALPSKECMYAWERSNAEERGSGKNFHVLTYPRDVEYLALLYNWATEAEKRDGLANDGQGKLGSLWSDEEKWLRSRFTDIKQAFMARGKDRNLYRFAKELGFDYQLWKQGQMLN